MYNAIDMHAFVTSMIAHTEKADDFVQPQRIGEVMSTLLLQVLDASDCEYARLLPWQRAVCTEKEFMAVVHALKEVVECPECHKTTPQAEALATGKCAHCGAN